MGIALVALAGRGAWVASGGQGTDYREAEIRPVPFRVNLNDADWPELSQLPGIGETLARRIVESREQDGGFRSMDDLRRVHGVGAHTLEQVRPYLDIPSSATAGKPRR